MRDRGLQVALMLMGVAVAGYAGCSVDSTTGGIITTGGLTSGDPTTSSSGGLTSSTSTGSNTTSSGSGSSTATGGNADNLGIQCGADKDCGAGLTCLTPEGNNAILGGGAPNGYCSRDCATDDDCPGTASFCLGATAGKPGICLLTCEIGPKLTSAVEPLDENKCFAREDVRCGPVTANGMVTACIPSCGSDDQCPAGRVCDPRTAVCVVTANTGLPMGDKCDPKATTPQCAGTCISFAGGESMCSSPCVLGGEIDFNDLEAVKDCGGLSKGLCAYSPANNGAGDFGICAEACKAQSDCQNPTFWCGDVGLDNGYCFGSTPCPKGAADCKSPDVCTETKYGPFCLEPAFPLGDAAPVGTSSSASASSSAASSSAASSSAASSSAASGSGGGSSSASTGGAGGAGGASSASTGP